MAKKFTRALLGGVVLSALVSYASADGHEDAAAAAPQCRKMSEIYGGGKNICENMWDGAFKYTEPNEAGDNAYTMWFFGDNPNDKVSQKLWGKDDHGSCHVSYYHKEEPSPEDDRMSECHPWKENACCSTDTLVGAHKGIVEGSKATEVTGTILKENYGAEYHWDRCGKLSPACERFFVQEACFYECEPHLAPYRKFQDAAFNSGQLQGGVDVHDEDNDDHNKWQIHEMPIRADYCDAWYDSCKDDYFCASDNGSFFSCAAEYKELDDNADEKLKVAETKISELEAEVKALEANAVVQSGDVQSGSPHVMTAAALTTAAAAAIAMAAEL